MLNKLIRPQQSRQVSGEVPIYHRYTLGVAGERFFKAFRDRRQILASPCPKCLDNLLPPKMYCERCFEETSDEWVELTGPGYVRSYTVLHRSLDEEDLDSPDVVAMIGWEGARGGLIHRIRGVSPDRISLHMAVEPVWEQERSGAMSDISHFRDAGQD